MTPTHRVLALNPGGMTTKIAVYEGDTRGFETTVEHGRDDLQRFETIPDQLEFRKKAIEAALEEGGQLGRPFDAIVGRGGLFRPIPSGTYPVNDSMLEDARTGFAGQHASNLGAPLAHALAAELGGRAFIVDPVSVDEFEPPARYSGHREIERKSLVHALNVRATAKKVAKAKGKPLDSFSMIVAHLGSGISITPMRRGRMIDVNNALSGGPFSPERTGALPLIEMFDYMTTNGIEPKRMKRVIAKEGGLFSYLGTNSFKEALRRIDEGDAEARAVVEAMAYQIAKEIGAMAAALSGDVECIVLTGALANSDLLVDLVRAAVSFIAPVEAHPGENELESLAMGALEVLRGESDPRTYPTG